MRTYDFAPLWRSSVGFDRLFDLINDTQRLEGQDSYPPYDIVRTGENAYRISLALAGFSPDEISITAQQNRLTVAGTKAEHTPEHQYLHQGIAARPFERQFNLEDHVEVEGASFENGLLQIDLARKIPQAMKPRRIEIGPAAATRKTEKLKTMDQVQAAQLNTNIEVVRVALVSISLEPPPPKKGEMAMGEPLRKLKIDGGDYERNNEDSLDSMIYSTPHRRFRIPRMSLTIPT